MNTKKYLCPFYSTIQRSLCLCFFLCYAVVGCSYRPISIPMHENVLYDCNEEKLSCDGSMDRFIAPLLDSKESLPQSSVDGFWCAASEPSLSMRKDTLKKSSSICIWMPALIVLTGLLAGTAWFLPSNSTISTPSFPVANWNERNRSSAALVYTPNIGLDASTTEFILESVTSPSFNVTRSVPRKGGLHLDNELIIATEEGNLSKVYTLLNDGANVHAVNRNGRTALIIAAQDGNAELVTGLLKRGADINEADNQGHTPLLCAVFKGHRTIVEKLLKNDVDVNAADDEGYTALMLAAWKGYRAIVEQLLDKGANVHAVDKIDRYSALLIAVKYNHTAIVEALLDKNADVNIVDKYGWNALQRAAFKGNIAVVKALLAKGARVGQNTGNRFTDLMLAVYKGHEEIVEILLKYYADVNAVDQHGFTLLMYAAQNGNLNVFDALLNKGAKVHIENNHGYTALVCAAEHGHIGIIRRLMHYEEKPSKNQISHALAVAKKDKIRRLLLSFV